MAFVTANQTSVVVKKSLEDGKDLAELIQQACKEGYAGTIEYILTLPHLDLASHSFMALTSAISRNQSTVVKLLLGDDRVDPTLHDCQVVLQAAQYGYQEIVNILLQDERVVNNGGYQAAFDGTVTFGNYPLFEKLVGLVDTAKDDNHAIRSAAVRNDARMMRYLLQDSRVDPTAKDNDALVKAACMGHEQAVSLLVADPRIYINGMIPTISEEQAQPFFNNSNTATDLIRDSVLQMFSSGEFEFDAADTLSPDTLGETRIRSALEATHRTSLMAVQEASYILQRMPTDIVTEVLWMIYCYSLFPWLPSKERKAKVRQLVEHS